MNRFYPSPSHGPADSRQRFLGALLRLLAKCAWEEVTVTGLCREAGLSRKSFYKYFPCREAILSYLTEALEQAYVLSDDYSDLSYFFTFWYRRRSLVDLLVGQNLLWRVAGLSEEMLALMRPCTWQKGPAEDPAGRKFMFEFIYAGLIRLLECWSLDGWRKTPQEMAAYADCVLDGNFKRNPRPDTGWKSPA